MYQKCKINDVSKMHERTQEPWFFTYGGSSQFYRNRIKIEFFGLINDW